MTAARLGYRTNQKNEVERLQAELLAAKMKIMELESIIKTMRAEG